MAHSDKKLEFRSLAWTGDEVGYRLRPERYVNHLKKLLDQWPAKLVILGFGLNESFAGENGLAKFRADLTGYLKEIERRHPDARVILLSPIATEDLKHPHYPDPQKRNAEIKKYLDAMAELAVERKVGFIDLHTPSKEAYARHDEPLTGNGIHLNDAGHKWIAAHLAREILGESAYAKVEPSRAAEVAKAVSRKAGYVATIVRPVNTVLYFGVRGRANEYNADMPRYHALAAKADAVTHALCKDTKLAFDATPLTLEPLVKKEPVALPSPAEMLRSFQVADGLSLIHI